MGAAVALLGGPPAAGQWEPLGARRLSLAVDRDAIRVGARGGSFTAVRLEVGGGDLELYGIKITFGDGASFSPPVRLRFREGSRSRTIDLPADHPGRGRGRIIRRIDFRYRSTLGRGRATVQAFGRRAAAGPGVEPGAALEPSAWDHLGMRQVDFRTDHDVVTPVGRGPFRAVRIDVEGGDLEMFNVRLVFADGETFSPAMRFYFKPGARSRVIDLPGQARLIGRVDFFYRSVPGGRGTATVHVYGRS